MKRELSGRPRLRSPTLLTFYNKLIISSAEGKTLSKKECPGYDTKLHLMLRLLFWSTEAFEIPLLCHYFQVDFEPGCQFLVESSVLFKYIFDCQSYVLDKRKTLLTLVFIGLNEENGSREDCVSPVILNMKNVCLENQHSNTQLSLTIDIVRK